MEEFFYVAWRSTPEELIDLFATRYGWSYDQITALPVDVFFALAKEIKKQNRRDELKAEWNTYLPFAAMRLVKFKEDSFEEYYKRVTGANIDLRPATDILAEAEEIKKQLGEQNGSV